MAYNRGLDNMQNWLQSQNQPGNQGFGTSYHPVRSIRYTNDYGASVSPAISTLASVHYPGRTVNATATGMTPGARTYTSTHYSPLKTSTLHAHRDQERAVSPYTSIAHSTPEKERGGSPVSDATFEEEEDPRTVIRKVHDIVKEIQKIDMDKYDLQYRKLMENSDPTTLTKELVYSQQKESGNTKTITRNERRLRKERDDLKNEIRELRGKLEEEEMKRNQAQSKYTTEARKEIDDLHMKLHEEEEKTIKRMTQFEEEIFNFQEKEKRHKEELEKLEDEVKTLKNSVRKMERERNAAEREKTEALTRLSKEMGNKLSDKNPNIADLSDANRPTKLAEKYNELYDNEWTDALEILESFGEEAAIKVLLHIMETSYEFCKETASEQIQKMKSLLAAPGRRREAWGDSSSGSEIPAAVAKLLKECQKEMKMDNLDALFKEYISWRKASTLAMKVQDYAKKCLEICWLMVIQDPPVVLGKAAEGGDTFDSNTFKEYTRTGSIISFTVWLPLILHENGPLLCKGTAQPVPSKPEKTRERGTTQNYYSGYERTADTKTSAPASSAQPRDVYTSRETDVDALFASSSRNPAAKQQERYQYEEKTHGTYTKPKERERDQYRQPATVRVPRGLDAENYRSKYGVGPKLIHTQTGMTFIYYDGRAYTQSEWDEMTSRFESASQGSSYA